MYPSAVDGRWISPRNFPVGFEAAKVIESHHIKKRERAAKAIDPPFVSVCSEAVPAVDRITPELSRGAEIIWRDARDHGWPAAIIEIKQLRTCPHIGAVVRHIDRNIAHHANSALPRIIFELSPLLEEFELPILVGVDLGREFAGPFTNRIRFARTDLCVPLRPHHSMVGVFAGHEEGVVIEPRTGLFAKACKRRMIASSTVGKEDLRRAAQRAHFEFDHGFVVDGLFAKMWRVSEVEWTDQSLILQLLEAEQHGIARKSGEALVRRITVPRRIQRKYLPYFLSRSRKEIREFVGRRPEITNTITAGQGGNV